MDNRLSNDPATQIARMQSRIIQLENQVRSLSRSGGGVSDLQSPSFMKRAFAVWGHYFVAQLIITIVLMIVFSCISMALGGSFLGALGGLLSQ